MSLVLWEDSAEILVCWIVFV
uniref:Uncharacterized protein n=1 Tax=Anguilla anguilla TaxID=7936 RepID=A0A0E9W3I7_ANGAN